MRYLGALPVNSALSLGAGGVLLVTREDSERLRAPTVPIRIKVGAGDSTIVGIVLGLERELPLRNAVLFGVAAGAERRYDARNRALPARRRRTVVRSLKARRRIHRPAKEACRVFSYARTCSVLVPSSGIDIWDSASRIPRLAEARNRTLIDRTRS